MLCPARLHGRRVGANLPGCSSLWRRPSFSWSPAAAPLWFVQRTTPAGAAQLRQKAPYSPSPPPRPWPWGAVEGWAHPTRWGSPLIFCQIFILIHYTMNCYELLLLLLYDALLWAAPAAAIWWIAMSCCWYMMNCRLLLLYDELLWAAATLYDAFRWCCYTIITSHLDHRISINNCSSFKCGSCVLRLN